MSPLACSLFALAAVLATAHGYCSIKQIGRTTDYEINYEPVRFEPPGVLVYVDWKSCPSGMRKVGEDIAVCNYYPKGPAPRIDGPYPPSWSYNALCSLFECLDGAFAYTKQYCDY